MTQFPFRRTDESPTNFFRLSALQMAGRVGWDIGRVDSLVSIAFGAITTDWLDRAAKNVPPTTPLPIARHHLGHLISTAGEAQVTEVLELAECIERLYDVAGIEGVLTQLKADDQYWQTFCHLTVASRLRQQGAKDLRLEPPAAGGQLADLFFVIGSGQYQAECYRPTYATKGDEQNERMRLAYDLLGLVEGRRLVISFALALKTTITPELRRELVRAAYDAVDAIQRELAVDPALFPCMAYEEEFGMLSVCRALPTTSTSNPKWIAAPTFPYKSGEPQFFLRASVSKEEDLTGLDLQPGRGVGLSHVAIWGGTADLETDPEIDLERFGHKLERKLRQTRTEPGIGRILFADAKESLLLSSPEDPRAKRLHGKLVQQHAEMAGVVLIKRPSQPQTVSPHYHSVPLFREGVDPTLVRLVESAFPPRAKGG